MSFSLIIKIRDKNRTKYSIMNLLDKPTRLRLVSYQGGVESCRDICRSLSSTRYSTFFTNFLLFGSNALNRGRLVSQIDSIQHICYISLIHPLCFY